MIWATPSTRITDMMYTSHSPPPWRAGTPRASFSSLQQPHHAVVEPVQDHHQDKLFALGKVAMKKSSWSRSGVSFSFWVDLVLACITAFGVFGCTAFIILPINFEDANEEQIYLKKFTYLVQLRLLHEPMNALMLPNRNKDFHIWLVGVSLYQNFDEYLKHQSFFHCLRLRRKSITPTPHFNALQTMRKT